MSEERFERIEGMLTQLIGMVGSMQKDMKEMQTVLIGHGNKFESMETRMDSMESKMDSMESKMDSMESKNEARHKELVRQIKRLEKDQDFIWEKAARNEREMEILKKMSKS